MVAQVEQLLSARKVYFIPSGKDLLVKCFNPKHEDNNPSMRIDRVSGIGHCFSCGFKLNIYTYYGVVADFQELKVAKLRQKFDKLVDSMRGLEMPEMAVPANKPYRGISEETLTKFGAFYCDDSDWENRIVFPLKDAAGKIRGFTGRHVFSDVSPKYLLRPSNVSPPMFPSIPRVLNNSVVLVEGIFDFLNLYDKGLENAMACMGTQTLKANYKEKLSVLQILGVTTIYFLFDGDDAGEEAVAELTPLVEGMGFKVIVWKLEEGSDPGGLSKEDVISLRKVILKDDEDSSD